MTKGNSRSPPKGLFLHFRHPEHPEPVEGSKDERITLTPALSHRDCVTTHVLMVAAGFSLR